LRETELATERNQKNRVFKDIRDQQFIKNKDPKDAKNNKVNENQRQTQIKKENNKSNCLIF
jgi:hypothetical protein